MESHTEMVYMLIGYDPKETWPAAAIGLTKEDVFMAADVLEAVEGDGRRFWHLWRAIRGHGDSLRKVYGEKPEPAGSREYEWEVRGARRTITRGRDVLAHITDGPGADSDMKMMAAAPEMKAIVEFLADSHWDGADAVRLGALFSDDDMLTIGQAAKNVMARLES